MNDDEAAEIFLGTMDDLAHSFRFRAGDYEAARAAALTRRLLFDTKSLYDRVSRGRNIPFEADLGLLTVARTVPSGQAWANGALLDPIINRVGVHQIEAALRHHVGSEATLDGTTLQVTRDALPNVRVAGMLRTDTTTTVKDHRTATIKDIVRLFANHLGVFTWRWNVNRTRSCSNSAPRTLSSCGR